MSDFVLGIVVMVLVVVSAVLFVAGIVATIAIFGWWSLLVVPTAASAVCLFLWGWRR